MQTKYFAALQYGHLTEGRRLVAGFAAGITEALVIVTPFEVVKIRLQQQRGMQRELMKYRVSSNVAQSCSRSCRQHACTCTKLHAGLMQYQGS